MRVLRSRRSTTTSDTSQVPENLASNSNSNQDLNFEDMFGTGALNLSSDNEDLPQALPMFGLSELALGVADDDDGSQDFEDALDGDGSNPPSKKKRVRHPPRNPVICEVCNKQFTRKAHLVRHMYLHTGEKPFKCSQCPQSFNRKDHLRSHMKGHTDVKQFKCNQCACSFSRTDHLRVHVLKSHGKYQKSLKPGGGVATSASAAAGGSGQQSASMMPKLGFKVLTCRYCSMKFSQTHEYNSHVAAHKRENGEGNSNDSNDDCENGTEIKFPQNIDIKKTLNAYVCIDSVERDLAEMHVETAVSNDDGDEEEQEGDEGDEQESDQDLQEEGDTGEDEEDDLNNGNEQEDEENSQLDIQEPPRKLECVVCGKENFADQRALRRHYKVHKRRFVCRFCGITMSSAGSLMRHNMLHTGEKPFQCNRCNRKFSRKDALKAHLVAHEKDSVKHTLPRPFVCTKCPASYTMRYNLIRHMRQCHQTLARNRNANAASLKQAKSRQQQEQQEIPQLIFPPEQADEHEEEEQQRANLIQIDPNDPLKCMHCNKVFASMKSLSTHVWYHNQEKRFTCKVCNRAFKYATDLNRHLMTHNTGRKVISLTQQRANNRLALAKQQSQQGTGKRASPNHNSIMVNGQRRYPCEFCTVIFNHRSNRSRHVRIFHSNQQQQESRTVASQQQLQQQQQQRRQLLQRPLQRQISLSAKDKMKRATFTPFHRRRVQPVSRNQLNLKGNQAQALMQAQQMQIRQARLSIESNDADDVQPNYNGMFKCDLCDKIFDKRYNYRLHLRTHNKQFSCIVCGLKTASQGDLTLHIRTHTGEKPFQCSFPNCEWKFARRSALTVHYRRHHGPNAKIKRQYNPQRVTPNLQVDSNVAVQLVESPSSSPQGGNQNNSILKTMLENYPCKSEPTEDGSEIEQAPQPKPILQQQKPKPKKNLPPPPPLIRYPLLSPAILQKKKDDQSNYSSGIEDDGMLAPEVVFLCKPCGQLISGKDNYVDHMLEQHGTTVTAIGSTPVTRPRQQQLNQLIPKKFAPPTLLRRPIQKQQQPVLSCQRCGEMFGSRHDMTVHNLVNHSNDNGHVMCGICRKLCSTIGFLSRHYQYCHPQARNAAEEARIILANGAGQQQEFEYDYNGQDGSGGGADQLLFPEVVIKEEMEEEGSNPTVDNDESEGDLSFTPLDLLETSQTQPSNKSAHSSTNSNVVAAPGPNSNLPYTCPLCSKGFKDKKALADHKWYHCREPIYPCAVTGCEKRFKLKNDLIRHMRRHLQERPHACPEAGCESRFYQKSDLARHQNKIHNQAQSASYACQHCSAGFTKPELLVRHMKSSHPGQDVSHLLILQMLDEKKKAEEKQMQEFLANLPPEEEEEEEQIEMEPEWSEDHDLDYSFELQQLEIDAYDVEDDLAYRHSLSPTERFKALHANKGMQQQSAQGQATMMEKLANENGALKNDPPFTCQTCSKVYGDRQKFIKHRWYHLKEFRYTCPEEGCGEKFKIKGHVEQHIRTFHNSEKPVKNILHCPVADCTRKFTRDYDLSNHLEKVHQKPPVMATNESNYDEVVHGVLELEDGPPEEEKVEEAPAPEAPGQKYWTEDEEVEEEEQQQQEQEERTSSPSNSLLQPCVNKLEEYTNELGELYCKSCNKHFKDLKTLQNHVYYHQRESKYPCEECGAKFKQRSDLRRHMSIHHDPNNRRHCIPCPQCNRSFTHERYLRIHLNKECDGAPRDEQDVDQEEDHNESNEEFVQETPQAQVEVEEIAEASQQQQQRGGEVWDGEEPPNPLMFVSSDMQGEDDQDNDEEEDEGFDKGHHTHRQPVFECDLCNSFFSRSNELILHKRSAHAAAASSQRSSASPSSSAATKGKLKTFSCSKCGMSFLQKGELTQHLQQYHLDELPVHQCQFCPKYFYVKKSLDTHRRRHHSHLLNLIACQICGMKFQAKEYLVSHMKSHHQIN